MLCCVFGLGVWMGKEVELGLGVVRASADDWDLRSEERGRLWGMVWGRVLGWAEVV